MFVSAAVVTFSTVAAARFTAAETVTPPVLVSPIAIVPAVTRSSSASVIPSTPVTSAPPRSIPVPSVNCRIETLFVPASNAVRRGQVDGVRDERDAPPVPVEVTLAVPEI